MLMLLSIQKWGNKKITATFPDQFGISSSSSFCEAGADTLKKKTDSDP